jgi:hypothetical protein
VDVGMIAQVTDPGLEHAHHADHPTEKARIARQCLEGGCRRPEEQIIQYRRVLDAQVMATPAVSATGRCWVAQVNAESN